jgi:hypothetical protein
MDPVLGLCSVTSAGTRTTYNPSSTAGDIAVHDGTSSVRLPHGADGQVLGSDSVRLASTGGVGWVDPAVFGTQYVSVENNNSNLTSTSATLRDRLKLTTPVLPAGSYRVCAFYTVASSGTGRNGRVCCFVDSSNVSGNVWHDVQHQPVLASVTMDPSSSFSVYALAAGTHTVSMCFSSPSGKSTITLPDAALELFRVA